MSATVVKRRIGRVLGIYPTEVHTEALLSALPGLGAARLRELLSRVGTELGVEVVPAAESDPGTGRSTKRVPRNAGIGGR